MILIIFSVNITVFGMDNLSFYLFRNERTFAFYNNQTIHLCRFMTIHLAWEIHFIFLELLISLSLQLVTLNHKLATTFSGNDIYAK